LKECLKLLDTRRGNQARVERSEERLSAYKKAFEGFSEEELLLLDGIVLDQPRGRRY
jgi:hypothetical protein